ncbi:MAG: Smr domain protein [Planctomycetes bacterium ADurb.Bin401]|nr:MAG: Smr domain protein [Planctomycetes bacterium ADurb.Bin401]
MRWPGQQHTAVIETGMRVELAGLIDYHGRLMSNEIDLHGYTQIEAVEAFVKFYNGCVKNRDWRRIEVIYGSSGEGGALRRRIRSFLAGHAECLRFEAGENIAPANPGVTMVFPDKALPDSIDLLAEEILEYCATARTITKISGKFRRYGDAKIQASVKNLEKSGALKSFYKGQYRHYQSTQQP